MGKKLVVYLLAITMLAANVDCTVLATEEKDEVVRDITEGTDVWTEAEETTTYFEEKLTEIFSTEIETELENIETVQESEKTEDHSEAENQETKAASEEDFVTEELKTTEEAEESEENSQTGYDLASEEETILVQAEMQGVYEFGESPLDYQTQHGYSAYSMRNNNAAEYIYQEIMKSFESGESETEIRVYDYGFNENNITHFVSGLKNDYPELYFVNRRFSYTVSGSYIVSVIFTYDTSLSPNKFKQSTEDALSVIKPGMSDLEKAIVLHDYLAVHCEYDKERLADKTIPYISYTAYGVLVEHIAVCQGYALTYKYLLNQVGIDCYMVTSDSMNHAWNLIVLDSEYYQVDVTWADPTWDLTGRARHTYMFLSDKAFEKAGSGHSDWYVTSGVDIVDYKATNTRYDNAFWKDSWSPLVIVEDDCYYVSFSEWAIKKETIENIEGTGTTVCDIGKWTAWGDDDSAWQGTFSGLFQVNDRLYYNDKTSIYSIDFDGGNKKTEFTADTSTGYIYGSALRQGKVYYCLRKEPIITAKETVLTADIELGSNDDEGITWTLNNGELLISGNGTMENYSNKISAPWFSKKTSITSVVIEDGISNIGNYVFYKCVNLTKISIPDSVTEIGDYAFLECSNIQNIMLPDNVAKIGDAAFDSCTSLTEIDIPEGITRIGISLFYGCDHLKKVTLPESILCIDSYAFQRCSSLVEINIPNNVTDIRSYAFAGCSSLTEFKIPQKLTYISAYLFYNCSSLRNITLPESVTFIGPMAFANCSSLSKIIIPAGDVTFGGETKAGIQGVFSGCNGLTSAGPIGGGYCYEYGWTEKIPDRAFWGCESLERVVIPDSVKDLGNETFSGCHRLSNINIPKGITSIGNRVFEECNGLIDFIIPEGIVSIGGDVFVNCANLKSIILPESINDIYGGAFSGCTSLESITIPKGITNINMNTFWGCSNLTEVRFLGNITDIGNYAFYKCSSLNKIQIPEGVTNIGNYAFCGCENLVNITIPQSVVRIGYCTFQDCCKLYEIEIPKGMTGIYYETFSNCSSLTSVTIPDSVTTISEGAFSGCSNITDIYYNGSLEQWKAIDIGGENACLETADIHLNTEVCTITFNADNGITDISYKIVISNEACGILPIPERDGYNFAGWYTGLNGEGERVTTETIITHSMTVYAKWVENIKPVNKYKVTYDMQGYGEQTPSETVEDGALIVEPPVPTAEDRMFGGWYKDAGCQNRWDFKSDKVSSNITLYAKWIPNVSKDVIAEGKIDESYGNIVWSIDKNGKLLVTGRGDYYSVGNGDPVEPPWLEYKDKIKTAKIALSGSTSVYAMFKDCTKLTEVDLSELNTDNVEYMYYMFDGCSSLTAIDLSNLKTSNVYTMSAMFQSCSNLKSLDLSNFDTGSLVDMEAMFLGCGNLSDLNLGNFNTGKVRAMGFAFAYCTKLTNLDLSSFDTENVTRLFGMFFGCSSLTALDLGHFNTDKVKDMSYMFRECRSLQTLDISNFNTSNVKENGCKNLLSGCISLSYIHAPKNCTYSVELPTAASTDKWYMEKNTECRELPKNLGYSVKLYKNLYLGSSESSVVVKFDLQNHGEEIDDLIIEKGQKIQKPTEPVAEGYTFGGWYKEPSCQNAWDFDKDIVTEDTTLYAKWSYLGDTSAGDIPESGAPEGLWIAGIQDYTYTGKAIKPQIRVYFKEIKLKEGQDYIISYKNNIKAAGMDDKKAPTVTIKGKGNYAGTAVKTFTINKAMLTASNLKAASAYQMGKAYTPVIILNGNVLKNKTDYTLTYKTADGTVLNGQPTKELGSYIMHIDGKGNCGGSFDYKYKLAQTGSASIEKGTATIGAMIYCGKNPSTMLTVDGKTLTASDYMVSFSDTRAKGTATATFIGIGKYTGVLTKKFKVIAQPLQNTNITIEKNVPYEKGGACPKVLVKANKMNLFEGVDYTISYKDNAKLGKSAKAIIKGKGNYSGSISVDFQIKSKPLNDKNLKILVSDVVAGKKPAVAIYDVNGKKLSHGSDYEARIDQTKHTVTIMGGKNGCYTGTVSKTYEELPADKIITSVKLNKNASGFPKNYNAYTGKAVTLKNEWLTVKAKNTVLPSNCFTLSYANNVEKGTATVIVEGRNGYSGIKVMTFKIKAYGLGTILTWFNPNPDETDNRTFTVRFLANGGSWGNKEEMTVTVKSGSTAVLAAKPTREGYVFTGWKDGNGDAFYENAPVTKDITVYAQWEAVKPTHTYADPFELPELTGDKRADFIAVAMSQVGYTEAEDGSTCFGAWAGDPYCKWCSEFAAWCAEKANIPKSIIPKGTSSRKYRNFFAEKGRYYYIEEGIDGKNTDFMKGYKNIKTISAEDLVAGDIILKESDGDINNGPDHTAIFLEYEDGIVTCVSGNANDSVMVTHCYIEEFHGVCRPDF